MGNILEYKGYYTKIEYSANDCVLHGKIEGISDLVNFESPNAENIEKEFHMAVDDYLEFCQMIGKSPDKSYKGSFNVRIAPELHKKLGNYAFKNDKTLNQVVSSAIEYYLDGNGNQYIVCVPPMFLKSYLNDITKDKYKKIESFNLSQKWEVSNNAS